MAYNILKLLPSSLSNSLIQLLIYAVLLVSTLSEPATAKEVITDFHSRIEVAKNGDLTVTETISVIADGKNIRRGIFRDFPRTFVDDDEKTKRVSFDIISIKRNGLDEPYHTTAINDDTRIYIGEEKVSLNRGPHIFEIKYRTDRQIGYFDTYDEVYWNVTGNGWAFPINRASAEVILPDGGRFGDLNFFTGYTGEIQKNGRVEHDDNRNIAFFTTTSPLEINQGLTIVVAMKKGVIHAPSASQKFWWAMRDDGHIFIGFATLLAILAYYTLAWFRIGRDPIGGPIVARWDIPDDVSPALVYYIADKERLSNAWKAMTAAIINLSIKGYLLVEGLDDKPILSPTQKKRDASLPAEEAVVLNCLDGLEAFKLSEGNGKAISSMRSKFAVAIEKEHKNAYYKHNRFWLALGIAMSVIGILSTIFFNFTGVITTGFLLILCAIFATPFVPIFFITRAVLKAQDTILKRIGLTVIGLISLAILAGVKWVISAIFNDSSTMQNIPFIIALFGIIALNVVFCFLLPASTKLGAQMTSAIEGVRLYLNLNEKERSALTGAPEMSPEHYEALLPYAIALDVEKKWSDAFEEWLTSAVSSEANRKYQPHWNRDRWRSHRDIGRRFGNIGSTMSQNLSSSTPRRSSSSGSSSGSSGGGGGGGGGGGW